MGNTEFQQKALALVAKSEGLDVEQLYVVWICKVLQNNKCLISTDIPGDGLYFEITYNGDKEEFYLDKYKKEHNICFNN